MHGRPSYGPAAQRGDGRTYPLTGQSRTESARCGAALTCHLAPSLKGRGPGGSGDGGGRAAARGRDHLVALLEVVGVRPHARRHLAELPGTFGNRRLVPHLRRLVEQGLV